MSVCYRIGTEARLDGREPGAMLINLGSNSTAAHQLDGVKRMETSLVVGLPHSGIDGSTIECLYDVKWKFGKTHPIKTKPGAVSFSDGT